MVPTNFNLQVIAWVSFNLFHTVILPSLVTKVLKRSYHNLFPLLFNMVLTSMLRWEVGIATNLCWSYYKHLDKVVVALSASVTTTDKSSFAL